jgi:hypothetical protein
MERNSFETVLRKMAECQLVDKKQETADNTKKLIDDQLKNRTFKEAMQSAKFPVPTDKTFSKLLERLEHAEKKQR